MDDAREQGDLPGALRLSGLMLAGMFIVARPLLGGYDGPSLATAVATLLAVALAALAAAWALSSGRLSLPRTRIPVALFLVILAVAVSTLLEPEKSAGADMLESWMVQAMVVLAALALVSGEREARFLVAAVVATAAVAAAYAVLQRFVGLPALREELARNPGSFPEIMTAFGGRVRLQSNRVFGSFVLPNSLAGYLCVVIFPAAALAASPREGGRALWARLALGLTAALAGLGLLLTGSKGGCAAAALGAGLWVAVRLSERLASRPAAAVVGALAVGVLLLVLVAALPESFPGVGAAKRSLDARLDYWSSAAAMIRDHPTGVGAGAFQDCYTAYKLPTGEETRHPHSMYLAFASELGLFGLAALVYLLAAMARAIPASTGGDPPDAPPPKPDGIPEPLDEKKLRFFGILAGVGAFAVLYAGPGTMESESIGRFASHVLGERAAIPRDSFGDGELAARKLILREKGSVLDAAAIAALRASGVEEVDVTDPAKGGWRTAVTAVAHAAFPALWCAVFLAAFAARLPGRQWAAALAGCLGAFFIHGLVDMDDIVPGITATVLMLAVSGAAVRSGSGQAPWTSLRLSGLRRVAAAVVAAAALSGAAVLSLYPQLVLGVTWEIVQPELSGAPDGARLLEAVRSLDEALSLRPRDDRLHFRLYLVLRRLEWLSELKGETPDEKLSEAVTAQVRRFAALRPRSASAQEQLGHRLMGMGDLAGAASAYESAARLYPLKPLNWMYLGDARLMMGDRASAADCYARALAADREVTDERTLLVSMPVYAHLAVWRSAPVERVLRLRLQDALNDSPPGARRPLAFRLAVLYVTGYHNLRSEAEGAVSLMKAEEVLSDIADGARGAGDPQALILLGRIRGVGGDLSGAVEAWEKALAANATADEGCAMAPLVVLSYAERAAELRGRLAGGGAP